MIGGLQVAQSILLLPLQNLYEVNPLLTPASLMIHYAASAAGGTLSLKSTDDTSLPDALAVSLEEVGFSSSKLEKFVSACHRKIADCREDSTDPVLNKMYLQFTKALYMVLGGK